MKKIILILTVVVLSVIALSSCSSGGSSSSSSSSSSEQTDEQPVIEQEVPEEVAKVVRVDRFANYGYTHTELYFDNGLVLEQKDYYAPRICLTREGDSIAYKQMPDGKIRPVRNVTLNVSLEKE